MVSVANVGINIVLHFFRISPATVTFILNELITSPNTTIRHIAHSFDWYFFPVINADGYAYTFAKVTFAFAIFATVLSVCRSDCGGKPGNLTAVSPPIMTE